MSFRSSFATTIGRLTHWGLTTFTRGGSSLPGKVATTIDPKILTNLARDYEVIIITGTNGKTLTTALTVHALEQTYPHILTNPTGSNMQQGIVSTFLAAPKVPKGEKAIAVLEVDEGSLKHVVKELQPSLFVHTNVFRDQLDRFGEVHSIYQLMADAAIAVPSATVLANGDSPMFNSLPLPNEKLYFGFDHEDKQTDVTPHINTDGILCPNCQSVLHYKMLTYANLGDYYCPNCHVKRPALDFTVNQLTDLAVTYSSFEIDGHSFSIPVAGMYNIYNALAAYSVARFFDVSPDLIEQGFSKAERVFGRQEMLNLNGKQVLLNLVKNPVGLNQVIDLVGLEKNPFTLVCLLNNRYADGTDVSWIWDGEFEQLVDYPIQQVITSGMKADEMTKRLKVAGLPEANIQQVDTISAVLESIEQSESNHVHILATYTAMLDLRKQLQAKGLL